MDDHTLTLEPVSESTCERTSSSRANYSHELELIRRIDWRFLLPDPNLGTVAYFGPRDELLQSALEHFAEKFVHLKEVGEAAYDLLVFRSSRKHLKSVCSRIRLGGFIYWEIERTNPLAALRGSTERSHQFDLGHPNSFRRRLEEAGVHELSVYWHRPNFEHCLDIVPLDCPNALAHFFSKDNADFKGHLKKLGGQMLRNSGLLHYLVPCLSLVGRKGRDFK